METVNQEQNVAEKTFTQSELDTIVGERLQRERSKYADYATLKEKSEAYDKYVEENKTELQKANDRADALQKELDGLKTEAAVRSVREKVSHETGVPINLLTGTTEEDCKVQAEAIKAYAKPSYPYVKDGGEPTGQPKLSTAKQFAEWFNQAF